MSDGYEPTQFDMPPVTPGAGVPVGGPATGAVVPPGGGGGYPPEQYDEPDRRPWIIAGLVGLIAVVAIVLLVLSGGDDGDDVATDNSTSSTTSSSTSSTSSSTTSSTSSTTSTTVVETTTTTAPAPTTTAAPTTTEAPPVTVAPSECRADGSSEQQVGLAADTVYDAFLRGDQGCAAQLMTAPALADLFGKQPQERDGPDCGQTDTGADCVYFTPGDGNTAIHLIMEFADGHWTVTDVTETEG